MDLGYSVAVNFSHHNFSWASTVGLAMLLSHYKQKFEKLALDVSIISMPELYGKAAQNWVEEKRRTKANMMKGDLIWKSSHYSIIFYVVFNGEVAVCHFDGLSLHNFENLPFHINPMPVPKQSDTNSCGYVALAAIFRTTTFLEKFGSIKSEKEAIQWSDYMSNITDNEIVIAKDLYDFVNQK